MLRIHFTVADAMRVRVVVLGAPAEVQQSFAKLRQPAGQALFDGRRTRTASIAPYWPRIRTVLENERATRADAMARHGLGAMLDGLAPALRWSPPVLEVPVHRSPHAPGRNLDVHLDGRGLLLAPSVFQAADPGLYLPWDDGPALLIYAVRLDPPTALRLWRDPGDDGDRAVASLLGATRAAALRAAADGCTTSELARRLNISPGGASQHATVLRQAGLITSHRHRNTVRHTITRLGADLLAGA